MELRLLGPLELVEGDRTVPVRGARQARLLAALALRPGETIPAERLIDLVWGDEPPARPSNALQGQVSQLRKRIGEEHVVTHGRGYALRAGSIDRDVDRFEALLADGRRLARGGDHEAAAGTLRAALELWRGPALADFTYDEFAQPEIVRLEGERLAALEDRLEADLARGQHVEVLAELEGLCARHPLRERWWALRMLALYRSGRQADALRAYGDARRVLVDELGIEPGPELRRLETLVLTQDPALDVPPARGAGPPPAPMPQDQADGPPGSLSASAPGEARQGWRPPAHLTSFVGRDEDLAALTALLMTHRLVTVTGPGGIGKTRLAEETSTRLLDTGAGRVWFVELAPTAGLDGVVAALNATVAPTEPLRPADAVGVSALQAVVGRLALQAGVVVLDNCEHVLAEAASVTLELLQGCPELRVLTTSREPLRIPGERVVPLAPLPAEAAVQLFVERATASGATPVADGDLQCVSEVCGRLDCLPLAIELAAARLRAVPLDQLAERLDDRFGLLRSGARTAAARQRTLEAVVDWSHDLLFQDERRLFARLGVFTGGCTIDAAEAVCGGDELPAHEVLDVLARLVEKSLVVVDTTGGAPRYGQLQTLLEYARRRLDVSDDAEAVRDGHLRWFLRFARQVQSGLFGSESATWRRRAEADLDNLRAALDRAIATSDAGAAASLTVALAWLWFLRGEPHEGARWLEDALAVPGPCDPALRARARVWFAYFAVVRDGPVGHLDTARAATDELRTVGTAAQRGEALLLHASTLTRIDRWAEALDVLDEAEPVLVAAENHWGLATRNLLLANCRLRLGPLDQAEAAARRAVEAFEAIGDEAMTVEPLLALAAATDLRGAPDAADRYTHVIAVCERLALPGYEHYAHLYLGDLLARREDDDSAIVHFSRAAQHQNLLVRAKALLGQAAALRRLGRPATGRPLCDEADLLAQRVGSAEGRARARAEAGWCDLAAGDAVAATVATTEGEVLWPESTRLLQAALALARDEPAGAARLLGADPSGAVTPAVPGSFASLAEPDKRRLEQQLPAASTA